MAPSTVAQHIMDTFLHNITETQLPCHPSHPFSRPFGCRPTRPAIDARATAHPHLASKPASHRIPLTGTLFFLFLAFSFARSGAGLGVLHVVAVRGSEPAFDVHPVLKIGGAALQPIALAPQGSIALGPWRLALLVGLWQWCLQLWAWILLLLLSLAALTGRRRALASDASVVSVAQR